MKKLLILFILLVASTSWGSPIYESSKVSHYDQACPNFVLNNYKANICEQFIAGDSRYVFMVKNHPENGITIELHKVLLNKLELISKKDGYGDVLVYFNNKNLFIVDDFGEDGKIDILLRVAASPQETVLGFSFDPKAGKLSNLISRKIEVGDGEFSTNEFIVVYPADKLKVKKDELRIKSGVSGKSVYKFSSGMLRN